MLGLPFSEGTQRVLLSLEASGEGYARGIAKAQGFSPAAIQKQLLRLEELGIVAGRDIGTARLFTWNPRYPLLAELRALLRKAIEFLPEAEREKLLIRRRPRKTGKP